MLSFKAFVLTSSMDELPTVDWSPTSEIYMMELICGLKQVKNHSYLAFLQLFDCNVNS